MRISDNCLLTDNPGPEGRWPKVTLPWVSTRGKGRGSRIAALFAILLALLATLPAFAQTPPPMTFQTPDFNLNLDPSSQTIISLKTRGVDGFEFTPSDRLDKRAGNGYYRLGDLTFRVRAGNSGSYADYSTATSRTPIVALTATGRTLAAADLTPTLPADCPFRIVRSYESHDGRLALRFKLTNRTKSPVQIGALGIPMVFNNIISDRTLEQAHAVCSFSDPYIGLDAGYIQVTRLTGHGPVLLVVPESGTPFEAYRPLREPTRPSQTFEGMYEWMVHSQAYAENEWGKAESWNAPTAETVAPGETQSYGVRFLIAPEIRAIESTLGADNRPVAVGVPGYVLPTDLDARLFLRYSSKVKSIAVEPAGAIAFSALKSPMAGTAAYAVRGKAWGRARLTVTYADGLRQSVSYYVTKPEAQTVKDLGHFLFTKQWFTDANDPFHRAPSAISYDREADRQVTQDSRVWIAGLGDEGGSGSWLAAAMKEFGQPDPDEVAKYEAFIDDVLWGGLQCKDGPNKYGVRKSLFFHDPVAAPDFVYDPKLNWTSWTSWNKAAAEDIGRGYNYPHVVVAYWAMYRIARNHPGLVENHPAEWYLDQAFETTKFLFSRNPDGNRRVGWVELGLMEGDVFLALLKDLEQEGHAYQASVIRLLMKERADRWSKEAYPFGSEMAWDSTGQEEVYAWCDYFGIRDKADVSLNSILGYMPTIPHWGYNGNARRYWDFLYGGKLPRIERQIHHYGSGINAIPVLAEYRQHPEDLYLLRVGYGGVMGPLTNIDQQGFASAAFHSNPSTLKWDAYSGDYGPNFFGHAFNTATYLVDSPDYGWLAFGGNVTVGHDWVRVEPKDSFRNRVYLAPLGLWLTLDAGTFDSVAINSKTRAVRIVLAPADRFTPTAYLRMEQPARPTPGRAYRPAFDPVLLSKFERGALVVPLKPGSSTAVALEFKRVGLVGKNKPAQRYKFRNFERYCFQYD